MPRHFPHWLKAYIEHTRDSESPTPFHFWTGVWTVAGALRRRVWIDMRKFQWTPNFYIILVGPPGIAAKSTTTRMGASLLSKVEGINFGPQSATWQAITASLEQAMEYFKVDEDTPPKKMSAISMSVTELGTLFKMDDMTLSDVMISLWDGQLETWGHDTKTTGKTAIDNPWLNLIGCTTPSWLQANFPQHMIGGGLTSRIVFVYGDQKRQFIAYPDEIITSREYYDFERRLIEDLQTIATLAGPYELSSSARQWGSEWYHLLWNDRPQHMASDRYSGYISRKQTHLHKLAIVLAASKRNSLIIEKEDLEEANIILTSVEPHMTKVFESIGIVDDAKHVAEVIAFVRGYKWLTAQELYNYCHNIMSEKDFKSAIRIAVESGKLKVTHREGRSGLEAASSTPTTLH